MEKVRKINGRIWSNLNANGNRITNLGYPLNEGDAINLSYCLSPNFGGSMATNVVGELATVSSMSESLPKTNAKMSSQLNCKNVFGISGNSADGTVYSDLRSYKVINYGLLKSMTQVFLDKATASMNMGGKSITNLKDSDTVTKQYIDNKKQITFRYFGASSDTYPNVFYLDMLDLNITANGSTGNQFQLQKLTPGDMPIIAQGTSTIVGYATNLKTFFPGILPNFQMVSGVMYATDKTNSYVELTSESPYGVTGTLVLIINIDGTCKYAIDKFTVASGITYIDFLFTIL